MSVHVCVHDLVVSLTICSMMTNLIYLLRKDVFCLTIARIQCGGILYFVHYCFSCNFNRRYFWTCTALGCVSLTTVQSGSKLTVMLCNLTNTYISPYSLCTYLHWKCMVLLFCLRVKTFLKSPKLLLKLICHKVLEKIKLR